MNSEQFEKKIIAQEKNGWFSQDVFSFIINKSVKTIQNKRKELCLRLNIEYKKNDGNEWMYKVSDVKRYFNR